MVHSGTSQTSLSTVINSSPSYMNQLDATN